MNNPTNPNIVLNTIISKGVKSSNNIFVAIKDILNTTKSLEDDEIEIVSFNDVQNPQELVFFIWLGSAADDVLKGSNISFTIEFIAI